MIKEQVIKAYMLNSKRDIAEILYDTVNSYEETLKDAEWRMEIALAQLESIEDRTCENCEHMAIYNRREVRCSKGVVESRALDNNSKSFGCNKYEPKG